MNAAVRIDPETGLKVFNTRAAKASDKIAGKGYSVLTDKKLKELPGNAGWRDLQCGRTGQIPCIQGSPPRRRGLHGHGRRVQEISGRRLFGAADPARSTDRRVRDTGGRRRLRRTAV